MSSYFEQRMAEIRADHESRRAVIDALPPPPKARKPKAPQPTGYVYFMRSGNVVKIGFSTDPRERQKSLRTGRPEASFICKIVKGRPATERRFHERFADYRMAGEWFELRGALARYLERDIYPVELPAKIVAPDDDICL